MKSLREIYEDYDGHLLNKWEHYIDIYDHYFASFRGQDLVFLEIGVAHGGSLKMWREYFGEKATLIGVDVNPECKKFEGGNTKIFIGSQEDPVFLEQLKKEIPKADILLDDGGHTMKQQIVTFNHLFDHVKENGLYACEDMHTSYWDSYGGGLKRKGTFVEFSKNLVDYLHGWHAVGKDKEKMMSHLTKKMYGLHFYDSILIVEKRSMNAPRNTFKGEAQLENHYLDYGQKKPIVKRIKSWLK